MPVTPPPLRTTGFLLLIALASVPTAARASTLGPAFAEETVPTRPDLLPELLRHEDAGEDGGPPRAFLPPPDRPYALEQQNDSDRVDMPVGGSGATKEVIESIAQSMRDCGFCARHLLRMRNISVVHVNGTQGLQGSWSGGRIVFYAQDGRSKRVHGHTVCHEFGHHLSLLADKGLGDRLRQASGSGDASYPTPYSKKSAAEHKAELITYFQLGDKGERPWRKGFQPTSEARQLMEEAFRCDADITVNYPAADPSSATTGTADPTSNAAARP